MWIYTNYHLITIIFVIMSSIVAIIYNHNRLIREHRFVHREHPSVHREHQKAITRQTTLRRQQQKQLFLKNQYNQRIISGHKKIATQSLEIPQFIQQQNSVPNPSDQIDQYLSLKDLYYNGVPDKYDSDGFKIRGIPPNPQLAISHLEKAIQLGYLRGWIELGQMYHYGFYDFPADLDRAEQIYLRIINEIPHYSQLVTEASKLYQEANEENQRIKTFKWLNIQYTTKIQPKKTLYEQAQNPKPKQPAIIINNFFGDGNEVDVNNIYRTLRPNNTIVDVVGVDTNIQPQDARQRNDMHNVHDHSVIATIRQSVEKLVKETQMVKNKYQCVEEIRQYLSRLPNNDKKTDAIRTLDAIERNFLPLSFTDLKEVDALALVWNRIHSETHKDREKVLEENLADELAECIEHSKPVCATGRFTRILDTLNVVDEAVNVRPTYAINEEMLTTAGKMRDDSYEKLDDRQKKIVDSLAPSDFQKQWMSKLKSEIKDRLNKDYVKTDILTEATFESEIGKWIDEI
jgi:hypothetical protein